LALAAVGCGHSEAEWQAQLDKYGKLESQYNDEKSQRERLEEELAATKLRVAELSARLKEMGVMLIVSRCSTSSSRFRMRSIGSFSGSLIASVYPTAQCSQRMLHRLDTVNSTLVSTCRP